MKRRRFLFSLLGLAAAPAVARVELLALPAPAAVGVDLAVPGADSTAIAVVDFRAEAKARLAAWFGEQMDKAMFAAVTAQSDGDV